MGHRVRADLNEISVCDLTDLMPRNGAVARSGIPAVNIDFSGDGEFLECLLLFVLGQRPQQSMDLSKRSVTRGRIGFRLYMPLRLENLFFWRRGPVIPHIPFIIRTVNRHL